MKNLVLQNINNLEYNADAPLPELSGTDVLLRVHAAGVCGSDIPRAYRDGAHKMPLVLGHEFAGEVVNTASSEDSNLIGKRAAVFPLIPCRRCPSCQSKRYEMCSNYSYFGSRQDGGFAEYVVVPKWNLIEIPDNTSYEVAAMSEPMAVAVHAMRRVQVRTNDTVVVSGAGTIGLLLVMFLLEKGVNNIYVIANHDFQLEKLMEIGLSKNHLCDIRSEDSRNFILSKTNSIGADVYFECVGSAQSVAMAPDVMAPLGKICFVGNPHSDMIFPKDVYWKILRKQLTVTGTWNSSYYAGCESEELDDWVYVMNRLRSNAVFPQKLITHRFSLEELKQGFEIMRDKSEDYIKIICDCN